MFLRPTGPELASVLNQLADHHREYLANFQPEPGHKNTFDQSCECVCVFFQPEAWVFPPLGNQCWLHHHHRHHLNWNVVPEKTRFAWSGLRQAGEASCRVLAPPGHKKIKFLSDFPAPKHDRPTLIIYRAFHIGWVRGSGIEKGGKYRSLSVENALWSKNLEHIDGLVIRFLGR